MKEIIRSNIKFIITMFVLIIFGLFGITYALKVGNFTAIGANINTATIDVDVTYDNAVNGAIVTNTNKMLPIEDSLVTGPSVTDERVLKVKFTVTGTSSNPTNTIYDIALHDLNIDCDLKTEELKWRLYKGSNLLSYGNLSPTFDTMANDRLVLTETQEDLTTTSTTYVFLLWISENHTGDISSFTKEKSQSKYLNKELSGTIKIETTTKTKKNLVRVTGSAGSCEYTSINVPNSLNITYNGTEQTLVSSSENYTLINNKGTNAGDYVVTAKLNDGYKWSDGSTDDKYINSKIESKEITITATEQIVTYSDDISTISTQSLSANNKTIVMPLANIQTNNAFAKPINNIVANSNSYTVTNLVSGHTVQKITLEPSIVDVGTGKITPSAAKIVDSNNNDVTNNYKITYKKGNLTVNCSKTAVSPIKSNKLYTGSQQIGVTGGENIILTGTYIATNKGTYEAYATPKKNYCWSDGTTTTRLYRWTLGYDTLNVYLEDTISEYTGTTPINNITITDSSNQTITPTSIEYQYYEGNDCSVERNSDPTEPGNYSVKATVTTTDYSPKESNCAISKINNIMYTVNFNANGGTASTSTKNVRMNEEYGILPTATKPGYSLEGWYIDLSNAQSKVTSSTIVSIGENHTLYAKWTPNKATVYFKPSGGSVTAQTTYTDGSVYKWSTNSDGQITRTAANGSTYSTFTYNYYYDGESDDLPNYNYSSYLNITKTGYSAVSGAEWKCLSGCTTSEKTFDQTTEYSSEDFCDTSTGNCSVVLGVNWKINQVHIRYNTNGGSVATTSNSNGSWAKSASDYIYNNNELFEQTINHGSSGDPYNYNNTNYINITKTGYTPVSDKEWKCTSGCTTSNKTFDQGATYSSDEFCNTDDSDCTVVLSANWATNVATIKYKPNGGTVTSSTTSSGDTYKWSTNSDGYITRTGANNNTYSVFTQKYTHGITSLDLWNYNSSTGLEIKKTGYTAVSGAEWKCVSGCTTSGKTFDQTVNYSSTDFCNTNNGNCTAVVQVNWVEKNVTFRYTKTGSSTYTYTISGPLLAAVGHVHAASSATNDDSAWAHAYNSEFKSAWSHMNTTTTSTCHYSSSYTDDLSDNIASFSCASTYSTYPYVTLCAKTKSAKYACVRFNVSGLTTGENHTVTKVANTN